MWDQIRNFGASVWFAYSRIVNRDSGWGAPMLLVAGLGTIGFTLALDRLIGIRLFGLLAVDSGILWCVLAFVASSVQAFRSVKALMRLSWRGVFRPRWWFELSRICIILSLFGFTLVAVGVLLAANGIQPAALSTLFALSLLFSFCAAVLFLGTATIGYVISFLTHRRRRGKAYDCVHYFYVIVGSVTLLAVSVSHWPPADIWPAGCIFFATGAAGLSIALFGFLSIIDRETIRKDQTARFAVLDQMEGTS